MASRRKACWEMVMTGPEKEDLYTHRAYYSQRKCKSNTFAYTGLPLNSNGWRRTSFVGRPPPPAPERPRTPRRPPGRRADSKSSPTTGPANGRASGAPCSPDATG
ncbi:hypothetical protein G6F55_014295 [Rhizopus delemar]|nr:hypothetical protein G6F55_014295 [Rhizopus delemar]